MNEIVAVNSPVLGQSVSVMNPSFDIPKRILDFKEIVGLQWIDKYGQHWIVDEEGIPNKQKTTISKNDNVQKPTIHQICYCHRKMKKFDADGRPCDSCRKKTRFVLFACPARSRCIFTKKFGGHFISCWDCYYAENDEKKDENDNLEEDGYSENELFIYRRARASVNRIS